MKSIKGEIVKMTDEQTIRHFGYVASLLPKPAKSMTAKQRREMWRGNPVIYSWVTCEKGLIRKCRFTADKRLAMSITKRSALCSSRDYPTVVPSRVAYGYVDATDTVWRSCFSPYPQTHFLGGGGLDTASIFLWLVGEID